MPIGRARESSDFNGHVMYEITLVPIIGSRDYSKYHVTVRYVCSL